MGEPAAAQHVAGRLRVGEALRPRSFSGLMATMSAPRPAIASCSTPSMRGWLVPGFWPHPDGVGHLEVGQLRVALATPMAAFRPMPEGSWQRLELSGGWGRTELAGQQLPQEGGLVAGQPEQ